MDRRTLLLIILLMLIINLNAVISNCYGRDILVNGKWIRETGVTIHRGKQVNYRHYKSYGDCRVQFDTYRALASDHIGECKTVQVNGGTQYICDKEKSIEELLSFYMGKNTPSRQEFIIENLKVEVDLIEDN